MATTRGTATTLKTLAYDHIRHLLLSGDLEPGASLSPVMLAKEIGISHTPVREAISQLESEGLVERLPRLGARVRIIDRRELEELFELRETLEADAAAWAAERISEEHIVALRRHCDQFRELVEQYRHAVAAREDAGPIPERLTLVNVAFHLSLIDAAKNRWLRKILDDLHLMAYLYRFRREGAASPEVLERIMAVHADHCAIVESLVRRDPLEASRCAAAHVRRAKFHQLKTFDKLTAMGHASTLPHYVMRAIGQIEASVNGGGDDVPPSGSLRSEASELDPRSPTLFRSASPSRPPFENPDRPCGDGLSGVVPKRGRD